MPRRLNFQHGTQNNEFSSFAHLIDECSPLRQTTCDNYLSIACMNNNREIVRSKHCVLRLAEAKLTPWLEVSSIYQRQGRQEYERNVFSKAEASRRHFPQFLSYHLSKLSTGPLCRITTSIIETIGLVNEAVTIVSFFTELIPLGDPTKGTEVTIKAGLGGINSDEGDHGGQISAVYAYNNENEYLGKSDNYYIGDGDTHTFTVDQDSESAQAGYISVANDNDGTCVAWVTVQPQDNTGEGAWTGHVGRECGERWFASMEQAGTDEDDDGKEHEYRPACTWIDKDVTDGTLSAALKFRTNAYGKDARDTYYNEEWCQATIFSESSNAISAQPGRKRDVPERPNWMLERLIVQALNAGVTAEESCGSETSWGPDYIGSDQKFCDMTNKTVSLLCELEDIDGCVEFDDTDLSVKKKASVARRAVKTHHKSYKTVTKAPKGRTSKGGKKA